jgi:small subunit ribosomal protein S15
MYLTKEKKAEIFEKNSLQKSAKDTGSVESQVALFTFRINQITKHLEQHPKDNASRLGLLKLVGKRKRLLNYLNRTDIERYRQLITNLGLRK